MAACSLDYKPGVVLSIQRNDIFNNRNDIVYPGAVGRIQLGKLLSDEGGEGKVYNLVSLQSREFDPDDSKRFVAKIYHDMETAVSKKPKILSMLDMMNDFVDDDTLNNVCWPYYAIYDNSRFVGFIMPKATGKTLANLFYPDIQEAFPHYTREELINVCLSIINKIDQLHSHKIIIGDINEDNYVINSPDDVFFIDTDSYQLENYPCRVERLEYKAPELIENDAGKLTLKTEGYSTAVLIFKLLMLGKHPFSSKNVDEYTMEERMIKGLFPYSIDNSITSKLAPLGFYSYVWSDFPEELKLFFINVFTRAEELESVKDISKHLRTYKDFIINSGKRDLVPITFKSGSAKGTVGKPSMVTGEKSSVHLTNGNVANIINGFKMLKISEDNINHSAVDSAINLLERSLGRFPQISYSVFPNGRYGCHVSCQDLNVEGYSTDASKAAALYWAQKEMVRAIIVKYLKNDKQ